MDLFLIALLGAALAALIRSGGIATSPRRDRTEAAAPAAGTSDPIRPQLAGTRLPDDVWGAFDAVVGAGHGDGPRLTTVGGMAVGDAGWVGARAAAVDADGTLWLDSTAVVHAAPDQGRVAVRRDRAGYHLQRHDGPVGLWDGGPVGRRPRVLVLSRFDHPSAGGAGGRTP